MRFSSRQVLITLLLLITTTGPFVSATAEPDKRLACLARAYAEHLLAPTAPYSLESRQGQTYPFDPRATHRHIEEELDQADLYSQIRQPYPLGTLNIAPARQADPGRLRHQPLFMDMYGRSASEVTNNLVTVFWPPCRCKVQFSKINGAAHALETVGQAIEQAGLSRYVSQPIGTFNWRNIAGTQRLSMHAFGIAIDFKLPGALGRYWRWELTRLMQAHERDWYPLEILQDEALNRIVNIFESHGFIWGGKWWHYDSIHFEYRPELSLFGCSQP
jgi:peptidoglycan L-alanyl-D-glutamate endopeptidase CwlK